jgi:hypothetical protein
MSPRTRFLLVSAVVVAFLAVLTASVMNSTSAQHVMPDGSVMDGSGMSPQSSDGP